MWHKSPESLGTLNFPSKIFRQFSVSSARLLRPRKRRDIPNLPTHFFYIDFPAQRLWFDLHAPPLFLNGLLWYDVYRLGFCTQFVNFYLIPICSFSYWLFLGLILIGCILRGNTWQCSEITLVGFGDPYMVLEIESGSSACKASILACISSSWKEESLKVNGSWKSSFPIMSSSFLPFLYPALSLLFSFLLFSTALPSPILSLHFPLCCNDFYWNVVYVLAALAQFTVYTCWGLYTLVAVLVHT